MRPFYEAGPVGGHWIRGRESERSAGTMARFQRVVRAARCGEVLLECCCKTP